MSHYLHFVKVHARSNEEAVEQVYRTLEYAEGEIEHENEDSDGLTNPYFDSYIVGGVYDVKRGIWTVLDHWTKFNTLSRCGWYIMRYPNVEDVSTVLNEYRGRRPPITKEKVLDPMYEFNGRCWGDAGLTTLIPYAGPCGRPNPVTHLVIVDFHVE